VISPHAQAVADDFDLGVTVAKMPSDASQRGSVLGRDFDERFAFSDDAHHRSIFKYEAITVAQPRRLWQVEQEPCAGLTRQHDPPPASFIRVE
jgi:hypothetical protein